MSADKLAQTHPEHVNHMLSTRLRAPKRLASLSLLFNTSTAAITNPSGIVPLNMTSPLGRFNSAPHPSLMWLCAEWRISSANVSESWERRHDVWDREHFEGLTTSQAIKAANPDFMLIGEILMTPLRCTCSSTAQLRDRFQNSALLCHLSGEDTV